MKTASEFAREYVRRFKGILDALPYAVLDEVVRTIEAAHAERRQIFIIGNGGSAATASHMMNDLAKGTIGHKGDGAWPRFRVISLTDNVALMTAWANDTDYARIFSEPLRNLAQAGDLLIAISASGRSPNILEAVRVAKDLGVRVIGLSGFGGGALADLADVAFVVPSNEYEPVEDVHMMLDHILTSYLYQKLRAQAQGVE